MKIELSRQVWDRIAFVFDRALAASGDERAALLAQLCGSDETIRREVEEMLAAHESGRGLMAERRLVTGEHEGDLPAGTIDAGERVGPYRVVSFVGAGGMGEVYRAERADGAYRKTVALKVLRSGYFNAELVRRFRIEREALARLANPGIATILDGGSLSDGRPYIVLEFVEGEPITAHCERNGIPLHGRLKLFLQVASAVQHAHGQMVVHRDIKPSNILVQADGTPRLLDFGIAKLLDLSADTSLAVDTTPEVRLFTPEYAAPEQLRGEPAGAATDVYALGVLLFELLTGQKPFPAAGRGTVALERAILEIPAPAPSAVIGTRAAARAMRGDLDRIVLMALRKEPERRYASAAQLGEDVERYLSGHAVRARPDSVRYRAGKFVARNRALVGGVTAAVFLLAGFAVTSMVQARRLERERDRAERERLAADDVLGILIGLFERANPDSHPGADTMRVTGLLDAAEREVGRLGGEPERQAALWRAVGRMRAARGEYEPALALLGRAYDSRRELYGAGDLDAARIHHEIALVVASYRGEGFARPMLDSSLAELEHLLGEDHMEVRSAMSDLIMATGDSTTLRALRDRLLLLERRAPSKDPISIADRMDARGAQLYAAGSFGEAAALYEASLALLQEKLPPEHTYIRTERRNLAMALAGDDQFAPAESLLRVAAAVEERIHGPTITRGLASEDLALTFAREGRADSAEKYERSALALFRAGAAPEHWHVWSAQRNLAFIAQTRGRFDEGLALLDSAIALADSGADSDVNAGYLTAQRIPFELALGRLADAQQSLAAAERRLGASPTVTTAHRADVHRYAGMLDLALGRPREAEARFGMAVKLGEPADEPAGAASRRGIQSCLLGVALARLGRDSEARPLLAAPCERYEAKGLTDPLIVRWISEARVRVR